MLHVLHSARFRFISQLLSKTFLKYRCFSVWVGTNLSRSLFQEKGFPQGSDLSITPFNIALNITVEIIPKHLRCTLYTDDLPISYQSSHLDDAALHVQLTLNRMSRSADSNGFRFTSSKTKVQHFTCLRGAVRHPDLSLYGKRLPFVK